MQHNQYRSYVRRGQRRNAALVGKIALQPQFKWFGRWNATPRGGTAGVIRRYLERVAGGAAGQRAPDGHPAPPGHGVLPALHGRRQRRGQRTRDWYRDFARGVGRRAAWSSASSPTPWARSSACAMRAARPGWTPALRRSTCSPSCPTPRSTSRRARRTGSPPRAPRASCASIGVGEGARVHAQRDPLRLDANNIRHGLRHLAPRGRQAVHHLHLLQRPRAGALQALDQPAQQHLARAATCGATRSGAGLGIAPTTRTDHPKADGYFYIGRPGFSGGSCNGGPLPVGSWWPKRALMFGQERHQLAPPAARVSLRLAARARACAPSRATRSSASGSRLGGAEPAGATQGPLGIVDSRVNGPSRPHGWEPTG